MSSLLTFYSSPSFQALATVQADIFKPTKYGGKYTVTLIPGNFSASYGPIGRVHSASATD